MKKENNEEPNNAKKIAKTQNTKKVNDACQKYINTYNGGEITVDFVEAYELLNKATSTRSKTKAIELVEKAYEICPACFDAILFRSSLEDNSLKIESLLDEGLKVERERLKRENYFHKDNIGYFYSIYETRPYLKGLYQKASYLAATGRYKLAIEVCNEILRLNECDNTGVRYLLMALYAVLEEEKPMLELMKKYKENNFEMLFPLMIIYYKQEKYKKAKIYLDKINKVNPNFLKCMKGKTKIKNDALNGYYRKGDSSEVIMYFQKYYFLIDTVPAIMDFVLEYSK